MIKERKTLIKGVYIYVFHVTKEAKDTRELPVIRLLRYPQSA